MSKIHHKQEGTRSGRGLRDLGVVSETWVWSRTERRAGLVAGRLRLGVRERREAKNGETGTETSGEKEPNDSVKWSTNPTHGVEKMEKTMKKDRAWMVLSLKMKKGMGLKGTM